MKPYQVVIALVVLALLLLATLFGDVIDDESRRVAIGTWLPLAILIGGVAAWQLAARSSGAHDVKQRAVPAEKKLPNLLTRPLDMRPMFFLVAIAGTLMLLSWAFLLYLGSVGGTASQEIALMSIRIVSAAGTTSTALLLSRSVAARSSPKPWVLQLGALLQLVLAFVGLTILPVVALVLWNGHIDFESYSQKVNLLLLLLPAAAVVYCMTRDSSAKR